jgi:hypothetical protein
MDRAVSLGRVRFLAHLGGVREGCAAPSESARCAIVVCVNTVRHHQTDLLLTPTNPPQTRPVRNVRTSRAGVELGVTRYALHVTQSVSVGAASG